MPLELVEELRLVPETISDDRVFSPKHFAKGKTQRVQGSFEDLKRANIKDCRFHNPSHTFALWYMMNGGDFV